MRKTVEIAGLIVPLVMACLFIIAAFALLFGPAAYQAGDTLLLALALFISSFAVAIHLLWRCSATSIVGVLISAVAFILATYVYVQIEQFGRSGYWQVVVALTLSAAACGWHLNGNKMTQTNPF